MITQFVHDYVGWNGVRSQCRVMIFSDDGEHLICFEDLGIGVSVTNASELLATQMVAKLGCDPSDCRFFETYSEYDYDSFDEIEYKWVKKTGIYVNNKKPNAVEWEATYPTWKPAPKEIRDLFLNQK